MLALSPLVSWFVVSGLVVGSLVLALFAERML